MDTSEFVDCNAVLQELGCDLFQLFELAAQRRLTIVEALGDPVVTRESVQSFRETGLTVVEALLDGTPKRKIPVLMDRTDVYFIQGIDGGPIKIGIALDVDKRLQTIQSNSPVALRVLGIMRGGQALETALHRRFREYRVHGEWFEPCEELLSLIETKATR